MSSLKAKIQVSCGHSHAQRYSAWQAHFHMCVLFKVSIFRLILDKYFERIELSNGGFGINGAEPECYLLCISLI
jgi:hypothetical protein